MKLGIAISGTSGIPNHYGGFKHIWEYVSARLVKRGHSVTVYNSHNHEYQQIEFNILKNRILRSFGQFVYGLNCLMDLPLVQKFLKYAEKLAIKYSQFYIADSMMIKSYIGEKYQVQNRYIPYGADLFPEEEREQADKSKALKEDYFLLMAHMEPENNIEPILKGFNNSCSHLKFKVLGYTGNSSGKFITYKFKNDERIKFKESIFDTGKVRSLQNNSYLYFHGHSVCSTNPSLLEVMVSEALITVHNNPFNKSVLNAMPFTFQTPAKYATWLKLYNGTSPKNHGKQ